MIWWPRFGYKEYVTLSNYQNFLRGKMARNIFFSQKDEKTNPAMLEGEKKLREVVQCVATMKYKLTQS